MILEVFSKHNDYDSVTGRAYPRSCSGQRVVESARFLVFIYTLICGYPFPSSEMEE